jgi:hypothetical protein
VACGDVLCDLLNSRVVPFGGNACVDEEGADGVRPKSGLPPACVVEQVGLDATTHGGRGVQGVLATAVLGAAAELNLGQVPLAKAFIDQPVRPSWGRELEPSELLVAEPAVLTHIKIGYARVSTGGQKLQDEK